MTYHRELSSEDFDQLITLQLRQSDIDEIKASVGLDPHVALISSIIVSEWVRVIEHKGKIIGIFGLSGTAPWFLATDEINSIKIKFLKQSRLVVQQMLKQAGRLENYVACNHVEAIQWLSWLGFDFAPEPKVLADPNQKFLKFYMEAKNV